MSGPTKESKKDSEDSGESTAVRIGPLAFKTGAEHTEAVRSGAKPISMAEAEEAASAQADLDYVNQNWGPVGKFAAGVGSGLTLGLGPGLAARAGLADPGHLQAAETSGLFTAGDIGGTLLPALLSGGTSLEARGLGSALKYTPAGILEAAGSGTERYLGKLLGTSEGLIGKLASKPLQMAARGAVEGAAINLGHNVGQSLITNEPLSAESIAASGADGALFGGLLGAGLGTVGALGSSAVESLSKFGSASKYGNTIKEGVVARRLGMSSDVVEDATAAGGVSKRIQGYQSALDKGGTGAKIGSSDEAIVKGASEGKKIYTAERASVIELLEEQAKPFAPSYDRLAGRLEAEIVAPRVGTMSEAAADSFVQKAQAELASLKPYRSVPIEVSAVPAGETVIPGVGPKAPKTEHIGATEPYSVKNDIPVDNSWKRWIKTRDQLEASISKDSAMYNPLMVNSNQLKKELLNIMDSEIDAAMRSAESASVGADTLKGIADKYAGASTGIKIAEELENMVGKRAASKLLSTEPSLTARDFALFGVSAATGSPIAGLGWLAAKGLNRKFGASLEPALAQMAYDSMAGTKAVAATNQTKTKIKDSLGKFFSSSAKASPKAGYSYKASKTKGSSESGQYSRKSYEDTLSRTEQLISANHQEKVRRYSEELGAMGYTGLGAQIQDVNNRAVQYLMWNMPPRKGSNNIKSLRPIPVPKGLDMQEFKFLRAMKGVTSPLSILDDMENGSLSRDQVKAMKYVYPEVHREIVEEAANQIYEMKAAGQYLPMDKIASLGIALDSPIDSTLESKFINGVQSVLKSASAQSQPQQSQSQPQPASGMSEIVVQSMTPTQKVLYT